MSQVPLSKEQALTHGSLLDVREVHTVQPQAGLLGDAAIQAAILRLVHSAPPGWFTLAPGAISGLIQVSARQEVMPQCDNEIQGKRSFVGAIEAGGHWACLCLTADDSGGVEAIYLDGLGQDLLDFAQQAATAVCQYWGKELRALKHRRWF